MSTAAPRVLSSGLAYVESPRWHDGRLWFAHWGAGEVVAVDLDGTTRWSPRAGPGWAGRSTGCRTAAPGDRRGAAAAASPTGRWCRHADLSDLGDHGWNEIVVDGRGNIYVNSIGFDFMAGARAEAGDHRPRHPGWLGPRGGRATSSSRTAWSSRRTTRRSSSSESFAGRLTAFDIDADGSLSNRRVVGRRRRPRRHLPRRRRCDLDAVGGDPHAHGPAATPRASASGSGRAARCSSGRASTEPMLRVHARRPRRAHAVHARGRVARGRERRRRRRPSYRPGPRGGRTGGRCRLAVTASGRPA